MLLKKKIKRELFLRFYVFCLILCIGLFIRYTALGQEYQYPRYNVPEEMEELAKVPAKFADYRSWTLDYNKMPKALSLRKYAPMVGNQGSFGTCVGWATAYAARTILEASRKKITDIPQITRMAYSGVFQYRLAEPNRSNCNGTSIYAAVDAMKTNGAMPLGRLSGLYTSELCFTQPIIEAQRLEAARHKIEDFTLLWLDARTNVHELTKKSLFEGNPVVIGIRCPASFDNVPKTGSNAGLWQPTESPQFDGSGRLHGNHALCVVGYDDNRFGGSFEVMNSWGTGHADGGFVYIPYAVFNRFAFYGLELVKFPEEKPTALPFEGSLALINYDNNKEFGVKLEPKYRRWGIDNNEGKPTYIGTQDLVSGTRMQIKMKANRPTFAYLIGTSSAMLKDNKFDRLFPLPNKSEIMNYNGVNGEIILPDTNIPLKLDNTTGDEYLIVIYSNQKLNIDDVVARLSRETGKGLGARLSSVLGGIVISDANAELSADQVSFKLKQTEKEHSAVALILKQKHI